MAKPIPMKSAIAKPKRMKLLSHSLLSERNDSSQNLSDSGNRRNAHEEQGGVSSSVEELTRDTSPNPAEQSQVRQQEDTQLAEWSNSRSIWERMRGVETLKDRMEFHNMQISSYRYLNKVIQNWQKKLGNNENSSQFAVETIKTNVLRWGLFMSSAMKAAIHLKPNYLANLEVSKNTNFEEIQS